MSSELTKELTEKWFLLTRKGPDGVERTIRLQMSHDKTCEGSFRSAIMPGHGNSYFEFKNSALGTLTGIAALLIEAAEIIRKEAVEYGDALAASHVVEPRCASLENQERA